MTIDEAIAKYNKLANNDRTCYQEEAQQLAEWLEELKILREEKSEFQIIAKDIAEYNYEMGMENGYNKAIDDLLEDANEMAIEVDVDTYTMKAIGIGLLEEIAEQLKAGGENDNLRR